MTRTRLRSLASLGIAGILAAALGASGLSCHSGTPAAPEGSVIFTSCEYVPGQRDFTTGDFQARITARVLDSVSNVPQTGVGVFFVVKSGAATFATPSPVRTNNAGQAQNTLIATGATSGNEVELEVFSGDTSVEIQIDVVGCNASGNAPPRVSFTVTPSNPTTTTDVKVNVSASTDDGCGTGTSATPVSWDVDWGDGTVQRDVAFSDVEEQHRYTTAGQYTITVTVEDCGGQRASDTRLVTVT